MEILGFFAAVLMGMSLGLIGGGGSILTVPILVYLFNIDPVLATAYSLFVVGITSLVGSYSHYKAGHIQMKTALIFGAPSIVSVYVIRKWIVPAIPDPVFQVNEWVIGKSLFIMILFAVLMLLAAVSMILKPKTKPNSHTEPKMNYWMIFLEGLVVGSVTGMVGAGGGFLIIPALVLLAGLSMKEAVGTSLLIIAMKSLIGFTGDLGTGLVMDFQFLTMFSGFSLAGIFLGTYLSRMIPNEKLKPAFGYFVLLTGAGILLKEVLL